MIYSQAQREDGTPVPVDEECPKCHGRCWFIDADDMGCQKPCPACTGGRRLCSWALILVGDEVLHHDTGPTFHGKILVVAGDPDGTSYVVYGQPGAVFTIDGAELVLICTEELPEHRRGHESWGWTL